MRRIYAQAHLAVAYTTRSEISLQGNVDIYHIWIQYVSSMYFWTLQDVTNVGQKLPSAGVAPTPQLC